MFYFTLYNTIMEITAFLSMNAGEFSLFGLKNGQNQVYINATITKYSEEIIQLCKKKQANIIGGFVSKQKLKDVDPYFTSVVASWW